MLSKSEPRIVAIPVVARISDGNMWWVEPEGASTTET